MMEKDIRLISKYCINSKSKTEIQSKPVFMCILKVPATHSEFGVLAKT